MEEAIKAICQYGGVVGMVIAGVVVTFLAVLWYTDRRQNENLQSCIEEHREDKKNLMDIIRNNTEALTRTTGAVENCTRAVEQNSSLVQAMLSRR